MKRQTQLFAIIAGGALFFLTGCGGAQPTQAPVDPNAFYTQAAQTVVAQLTETALAAPVTDTPTPSPQVTPTLTATLMPLTSGTPSSTSTQFVFNTPVSTQATCDNFLFLGDVTIPDYSTVGPDQVIDKTWKIQNTGPCNWDTNYRLVYGWSHELWQPVISDTPPVYLTDIVYPSNVLNITVTITTPKYNGTYHAAFRMQNANGYNFGIALTVVVTVVGGESPETPTPTP